MNNKFEQTRKYAADILNQRDLINRIHKPMRKYWYELGNPNPDDFAKHVLHCYDIGLKFDSKSQIEYVEIKNQNKYTLFMLKYG